MKLKNLRTTVLSGLVLVAATQSRAQENRQPPQMDEATKKAFEICKDKMPARDSGTRPTVAQFEAFQNCIKVNGGKFPDRPPQPLMDDATKKAIESCKEKMPGHDSGERPSKEQFETFRACVESNGGQLPEHGPGGHGRGAPKFESDGEGASSRNGPRGRHSVK